MKLLSDVEASFSLTPALSRRERVNRQLVRRLLRAYPF